jgi:hypothetical protein
MKLNKRSAIIVPSRSPLEDPEGARSTQGPLRETLPGRKLNKRPAIIISLCCSFLLLLAFMPKADDPLDKLVASLQHWFDTNPQEKVYLQTDKPYYLVGDTIWFKGYVTTGDKHQLSAVSGALYVDLITEGDSIAKELKLPITAGMSVGNFILGDDIVREGNYRIRAYTQWMRNAGPEYFYDHTFTVGNSIANTVFSTIDYVYTKDGSKTKIKAILKYTDEKGNPITNKEVRYELKKGYQVLTGGGGKTNPAGQISINLPNAKPGDLNSNYLFTKVRITSDESVVKTFPIKTASLQTDVQFFPESGNLVNGVKSRVAFKVTAANGLGANVTGTITDNTGKEIAQLEVKHLGMGYFFITPEAGKTYSAKVTYSDASVNTLPLPTAIEDGYVLSVYHTGQNDSVLVKISTAATTLKGGSRMLNLIGQSEGKVYFATTVAVSGPNTLLAFPVHDIPSGILQFTLFSPAGDPLNERITFIQNQDNIDLKISGQKQIYGRREKVDLNVNARDGSGKPVGGNFSVSVISENAVPSDDANENSIFSQLLLTSDIKGYVEKPNYYFYNPTDETRANLDILMLTQGYRRFNWKNLATGAIAAPVYKSEKLVNTVTGRLTTYNHKPVVGGHVIIINNKLRFTADTVTDSEGRFKFGNLLITNGVDFTVQGTTATGGKNIDTEVDLVTKVGTTPNINIGDINVDIPKTIKASVENDLKQDQELQKIGQMGRAQLLKEVRIKAAKAKFGPGNITESQADEVFRPDSRMPCTTLRECLEEMYRSRIRFNQVMNDDCGLTWIPMFQKERYIVMIDRMIIGPCEYQSIFIDNTSNIDRIYTSHESPAISAKLLGGYVGGGSPPPVLAIFTKNGAFRYQVSPSVVHYSPKGYDYTKEFYSPKYDNPAYNPPAADLRSTVYWNPRVLTGQTGQTKISYYNGDQIGTYRVIIEGINADGLLARQVYRYTVQ